MMFRLLRKRIYRDSPDKAIARADDGGGAGIPSEGS